MEAFQEFRNTDSDIEKNWNFAVPFHAQTTLHTEERWKKKLNRSSLKYSTFIRIAVIYCVSLSGDK